MRFLEMNAMTLIFASMALLHCKHGHHCVKHARHAPQIANPASVSIEGIRKEKIAGIDRLVLRVSAINLNEPSGRLYLDTIAIVHGDSPETEHELWTEQSKFVDITVSYLSSLRYTETVGGNGKARIKADLAAHFDTLLTKGKVSRIDFIKFIVRRANVE